MGYSEASPGLVPLLSNISATSCLGVRNKLPRRAALGPEYSHQGEVSRGRRWARNSGLEKNIVPVDDSWEAKNRRGN